MKAHKIAASIFGIGYAKGGGTIAALATCLVWYALQYRNEQPHYLMQVIAATLVTALGIWNGNVVEKEWGKDSSRVVIDEVAGQCVTLLFIAVTWQRVLVGLVLFRIFDIWKPLWIKRTENLKGGWGVMIDDVVAGIYANVLLQIIVHEKWL